MAASGYSPISLYYSTTASATPTNTNLVNGELALNITDGKLFYKDNAGTVQTLATKAATSGSFSTTTISTSETLSYGTANGVAYLNGSKVVTTGSALTFDGTNLTLGGTAVFAKSTVINALSGSSAAFAISDNATTTMYANNVSSGVSALWSSGALAFGTNNGTFSEQMRLTSTGLGIGTSSPSYKLDVQGTEARVRDSGNVNFAALNIFTGVSLGGNGAGTRGIQTTAADALTFGTNSTERMRLDSSGNLGLGVTPSAWAANFRAIDINGAQGGGAVFSASNVPFAGVMTNAYFTSGGAVYKQNGFAGYYLQDMQTGSGGTHKWYTAPSGTAGNAISFTQAMTLDASGNLGIGTSSPGYKLDVNGTARFNNTFDFGAGQSITSGSGAYRAAKFGAASGAYNVLFSGSTAFQINDNADTANLLVLTNSGNLGIGTSSPGSKLHLYSALGTTQVTQDAATAYRIIANNGINYIQSGAALSSDSKAPLVFTSMYGVTEWMRIDTSGNLGIGTSSPTVNLHVYNASSAEIRTASANIGLQLYSSEGAGTSVIGTYTNHALVFRTNATERARIDSSGNFLVGTAAIATNATDGFLYIPTCAGTPTGTPTTKTGLAPMVIDSTNNKMYIYSGGAWRALN